MKLFHANEDQTSDHKQHLRQHYSLNPFFHQELSLGFPFFSLSKHKITFPVIFTFFGQQMTLSLYHKATIWPSCFFDLLTRSIFGLHGLLFISTCTIVLLPFFFTLYTLIFLSFLLSTSTRESPRNKMSCCVCAKHWSRCIYTGLMEQVMCVSSEMQILPICTQYVYIEEKSSTWKFWNKVIYSFI